MRTRDWTLALCLISSACMPELRVLGEGLSTKDQGASPSCKGACDDLNAAIVWYALDQMDPVFGGELCTDGAETPTGFSAVQSLVLHGNSPYKIDFDELAPPPEQALSPMSGSTGRWTMGELVLFRDGNDDGQLEFRSVEESAVDEIVAASGRILGQFEPDPGTVGYVIYYAEATSPDYGEDFQPGFNLFRDTWDEQGNVTREKVSLNTKLELEVDSGLYLETRTCEVLCNRASEQACPATYSELPEGGAIECFPSGSFLWVLTTCSQCTCETTSCSYDPPPEAPLPADWPCPVQSP